MFKILIPIICLLVPLNCQNRTSNVFDPKKYQFYHIPAEPPHFKALTSDGVLITSKPTKKPDNRIMFNFPNSTYGIDSKRQTTAKEFITGMSVIFPGTKWCGPNDNPESYEDLGNFYTTDKCCRGHDHCPHTIPGRSQKYGLWNTGLFTRSHCDCERKFYLCLKDSKSVISGQLGFTYFTLFGPQCFREDYPIIGCGKWGLRRCERYIYDYHGEVKYQWFDNLYF